MNYVLTLIIGIIAVFVGSKYFKNHFTPELIKGKRVVITGASTGIGEQIAYIFAAYGANVMITARRETRLKQVLQECQKRGQEDAKHHYYVANMENTSSYVKLIQEVEKKLGGLDYLVLNHITTSQLGYWNSSSDNLTMLQNVIDVNFVSYVHVASHAMALLQKSSGSIMIVSSVIGKVAMPLIASYSASKFALQGFFSSLRQELAMRREDVSISFAILGKISTENSDLALNKTGLSHLHEIIPGANATEAAMAIVHGTALRQREVYYPYVQTMVANMMRDIATPLLELYTRYLYTT